MKKILVTAFGPFQGEQLNPSQEVLDRLQGLEIDKLLLPVVFTEASAMVKERLSKEKYHAILMLGQAGFRKNVCLERVALNWVDSDRADESGFIPEAGPIDAKGPSALISDLPLTAWASSIENCEVSLSAGAYVCNYLSYQIARVFNGPSLFVHLPFLPEQTTNKSNAPSIDLDKQLKIVQEILLKLSEIER